MSWVDLNLIPGENLDLYTTLFNPNSSLCVFSQME
jgi:hypothetical protein